MEGPTQADTQGFKFSQINEASSSREKRFMSVLSLEVLGKRIRLLLSGPPIVDKLSYSHFPRQPSAKMANYPITRKTRSSPPSIASKAMGKQPTTATSPAATLASSLPHRMAGSRLWLFYTASGQLLSRRSLSSSTVLWTSFESLTRIYSVAGKFSRVRGAI